MPVTVVILDIKNHASSTFSSVDSCSAQPSTSANSIDMVKVFFDIPSDWTAVPNASHWIAWWVRN